MFEIKLKQLLYDNHMNQSELKRQTGIRYNTINAYYHGYVKRIRISDLIKICDALNCPLYKLLEYDPEKKE